MPGIKAQEPIRKSEIDFRQIGKIRPRTAAEIKASYLGVGCEVLGRGYAYYEGYKKYLGNLGVKHARFQSCWAKTEKEKEYYDFTWLDPIINDCISRGIQPWINISYGNPIYPGGGDIQIGTDMPHSETALKAWDAYVYNLVNHFKSRVFEWEVWNEANNLRGLHAGPEIYGDLFIRTAEIIREIQPEAKIIALAIGFYAIDYVRAFFDHLQSKGKVHLVDVVSMHGYPMNPDDDRLDKLIHLVKQYDDRITFLQGEAGAPSQKTIWSMAKTNFSELIQAKWNLRRSLLHIGRGIPYSQFAISDMKYPSGMNTKGLLKMNEDLSIAYPKQSYFAYQNLTSLFDSTIVASTEVNCELKTNSASSFYTFLDKISNKLMVTYWYSGNVPDNEVATKKAKLKINGVILKSPVLVDIRTGLVYQIPKSAIKKDNNVLELKIPIYDSPLLICEKTFLKDRGILIK